MADATGETDKPLRVAFDRRIKFQFHGAQITSDGGLLAYRELEEILNLTLITIKYTTTPNKQHQKNILQLSNLIKYLKNLSSPNNNRNNNKKETET